jgi:hypothetical protein
MKRLYNLWRSTSLPYTFLIAAAIACGGAEGDGGIGFPVDSPPDLGVAHLTVEEVEAILAGQADPPEWSSAPATSGTHAPTWAPCGIYREEVPEVFTVHTLEHGAVIAYYRPGEAEAESLAEVEELARTMSTHIIVMPFSPMETPAALVAWGQLAARPRLEAEELRVFWAEFAQRGPEAGIPCPVEIDQAEG